MTAVTVRIDRPVLRQLMAVLAVRAEAPADDGVRFDALIQQLQREQALGTGHAWTDYDLDTAQRAASYAAAAFMRHGATEAAHALEAVAPLFNHITRKLHGDMQ